MRTFMNHLNLRLKFPRLSPKYLKLLRFVYRLRPACYTFGNPSDSVSLESDMETRDRMSMLGGAPVALRSHKPEVECSIHSPATPDDALPTTLSPHPLPPAEIGQGVTRCFSHSEMWCYCCCSKSGGAY